MATILETMRKLGTDKPVTIEFSSEDLPFLIMSVMSPLSPRENVYGLLLNMAIRIEELEQELFALKFGEENDTAR